MIIAKLSLILGLITGAIVVSLHLAGILETNQTLDVLAKVLGIIAIFGVAGGLISLITGPKKSSMSDQDPQGSGPKF